MSKMHYLSNKFLNITKLWGLTATSVP